MSPIIERRRLILILTVLAVILVWAPAASAIVAHNASGHFWGVTPRQGVVLDQGVAPRQGVAPGQGIGPRQGVSPLQLAPPAPVGSPPSRAAEQSQAAGTGALGYHGGPVLHSSAPYLIFWDPGGSISAGSGALMERYFIGVAAASGAASNLYAVARQYTDASGFADYRQSFSPATHSIRDTNRYPKRDTTNCPDVAPTYPICLTDAQLQSELARVIAAQGLPTGTGANAPIYFLVTPAVVNVCMGAGVCTDGTFCAYHSAFTDGPNDVLYAAAPLFFDGSSSAQDPKACQFDNTNAVQQPNGDIADVALKSISHEDSETITDPLGTAWFDSTSGNENGDNCNVYGPADPVYGSSPDAFLPTLGGSSIDTGSGFGTLYDQQINGNPYYLQGEWSNGEVNCQLSPSGGTVSPSFTTPGAATPGASAAFDPGASSSTNAYSSATWSFGDGSAPVFTIGAPMLEPHTFATPGPYLVSLTLVDTYGNLATNTHTVQVRSTPTSTPVIRQITVLTPPSAAYVIRTGHPATGVPVRFDAASSSDPAATIRGYAWSFGDGGGGSGQTAHHVYAAPGRYPVTLKLTDGLGRTASVTAQVTVAAAERIRRISFHQTRHGAVLALKLDGPGTLYVGSHRFMLARARTVSFELALTGSQRRRLRRQHRLRVKLAIRFVPLAGNPIAISKTVTLRT